MKLTEFIANQIVKLRLSVDWSQSELARQTGVTSAAINQIERGDRMPSLRVLIRLAETFDVPLSELIDKSENDINDKKQVFSRKFGILRNISEEDQALIIEIAKRLSKLQGDK